MTETLVGGSTLGVLGGVTGLGNSSLSDLKGNVLSLVGAMGGLLYSLRSALVKT